MAAIVSGPQVRVSDDDLRRISETNPGWKFERADDGALLVSPTSTPGGAKSAEALVQLYAFAKRAGGKAYDAGTGFKTPGGGVVSPGASWVSAERVAQHRETAGFWPLMPDIVIEVASPTDAWPAVKQKIEKYLRDGCAYAVAIDPETGEAFERGTPPAGLTLDFAAIVDA